MRKYVDLTFDVGAEVYLKTDNDQRKRIVTAIAVKQTGITYELSQGVSTSWHYDFEISEEVDVLAKTVND